MTITVTWGGRELAVEVEPDPLDACEITDDILLSDMIEDGPKRWWARATPPGANTIEGDEDVHVEGEGLTAQAALDALAVKLRALAAWATKTLAAPGL